MNRTYLVRLPFRGDGPGSGPKAGPCYRIPEDIGSALDERWSPHLEEAVKAVKARNGCPTRKADATPTQRSPDPTLHVQ